jgi:hypothetical protein
MDVRTVKDLCQRLDEVGTILELMEGEPINVALHREASDALYQALSEIERLPIRSRPAPRDIPRAARCPC